jgi:hypothetical protein
MAGIGNSQLGGFYSGTTFPPDTLFYQGCTFEAPCSLPPGSILIDCTFIPLVRCGAFGKRPCPVFSTIGPGSISKGGTYEYVIAEATGRWDGVTDGPEGNVTAPDCRDCAAWAQQGTAVTANTDAIVGNGSSVSAAAWCNSRMNCTDKGTIIVGGGGNCTVTINGVTTVTG